METLLTKPVQKLNPKTLAELAPLLGANLRFSNGAYDGFTGSLGQQVEGSVPNQFITITYDKTGAYPATIENLTEQKLASGKWSFQRIAVDENLDFARVTF